MTSESGIIAGWRWWWWCVAWCWCGIHSTNGSITCSPLCFSVCVKLPDRIPSPVHLCRPLLISVMSRRLCPFKSRSCFVLCSPLCLVNCPLPVLSTCFVWVSSVFLSSPLIILTCGPLPLFCQRILSCALTYVPVLRISASHKVPIIRRKPKIAQTNRHRTALSGGSCMASPKREVSGATKSWTFSRGTTMHFSPLPRAQCYV